MTSKFKLRKRSVDISNLTAKQVLFVQHLLADPGFNASNAAKKAGYKNPGVDGTRLMKNETIAAYVGREINARMERTQLNADRVLQQLYYLATRNTLDLFNDDGSISIEKLKELPESVTAGIDGFKIKKHYDRETGELIGEDIDLKLAPKLQAIDLAMKHLGLFAAEKKEIQHSVVDWDAQLEESGRYETDDELIDGVIDVDYERKE